MKMKILFIFMKIFMQKIFAQNIWINKLKSSMLIALKNRRHT